MNIFRMLILILVSTIQISGMLSNISWESLQLTSLTGKVCNEVKHRSSFKMDESKHQLSLKEEDLQRINSNGVTIESQLKNAVQPFVISNKSDDLPVIKTSENNQQPVKNISGVSQIIFNGTVNAELF